MGTAFPPDQAAKVKVACQNNGALGDRKGEHLGITRTSRELTDVAHGVAMKPKRCDQTHGDVLVSDQQHQDAIRISRSIWTDSRAYSRAAAIPSRVRSG